MNLQDWAVELNTVPAAQILSVDQILVDYIWCFKACCSRCVINSTHR